MVENYLEKYKASLKQRVDSMDDTVCRRNIRGQDLRLVDLDLSCVRLLHRNRMGSVQRVTDLIEAHARGEQRSRRQMAHHELGRFVLVVENQVQLFLGAVGKGGIDGRKYCIRLGAGFCFAQNQHQLAKKLLNIWFRVYPCFGAAQTCQT